MVVEDNINPKLFSIGVHHGGNFSVERGRKYYVGGQISYSDYEDRNRVSILDLKEIAKKCGLTDVVDFYYNVPSSIQDGGFIIMQTDNHVMDMVRHIKDNVVEIFLVISSGLEDVDIANWDWECGNFPESGNTIERLGDVADDGMQGDGDSESDENYDIFIDSDYDLNDEDDRMYEENIDVNTEGAGSKNSVINGDEKDSEDDLMYEDKEDVSDSDDGFSSLNEAEWEDEQRANKAQVFRSLKGREEPVFCMGMLFRNRAQLAGAIRQHSILQGREIRFLKNETTRVRAKCKVYKEEEGKVDCTWEISATNRATNNKTLKVVAYNPNHNCGRIWDNKLMNSSWLARIYFDDIRISPNIKTKELVEKVRQDFTCNVSRSQCYMARRKVLRKIEGRVEDQYAKLWDYCHEIKRTNPDTSVYIHLKPDQDGIATNVFQRFYICWEALKKGFVEGCRPIVGVDGTHLKGGHNLGQLLTAVGIDANDQTFPVAYAIVEQENTSTWTWFLKVKFESLAYLLTFI
ncbi:hypothetical protein RHGRI_034780 [Rhododendron griersonianum]|uniref:Transposase MuDR plant domain-containing protein n=1 Tax=Rhododendron griersonianum TaxID=479676 RepID=A0AAV6I231_9ERIC|nr:hypothetical protein RHGRI_034780 [Rhododendron griersonianum]